MQKEVLVKRGPWPVTETCTEAMHPLVYTPSDHTYSYCHSPLIKQVATELKDTKRSHSKKGVNSLSQRRAQRQCTTLYTLPLSTHTLIAIPL